MKRLGVMFILLLAFGGLADAAYLAQHEAAGTPLLCDIQHLSGCNTVAQSPYSYFLGVPLADYGILFYSIVFAIAALELVVFDRRLRRALQWVSVAGLLASIAFLLVQVFLIQAFCIYCLASGIITLLIFILATLLEPLRRPGERVPLLPSLTTLMPPSA